MPLPAGLQNSHQNGGPVFLIFVADPITVRLYIFDSSVPQLHGKQAKAEVVTASDPGALIDGVHVDVDEVLAADFGQWERHNRPCQESCRTR
jgi:hypothetical protein